MKIKKGYRVEIQSWENDGDCYNTKVIETESKKFVKLIVDVCKVLKSRSNNNRCVGNMYDPNESELSKIKNIVKPILIQNSEAVYDFYGNDCNIEENALDVFSELHYELCGGSENFYTRVVSKFSVSYSPVDIEIADVTAEFI